MCVQPPSCSNASVRSNSAFEYSGSASIMSPQISGNPASRAQSSACVARRRVGAAQPPQLCIVRALHAKADARHACRPEALQRLWRYHVGVCLQRDFCAGQGLASFIKSAACSGVISAGVPPPKYSVSGRRLFLASSPQQGVHIGLRHALRPGGRVKITVAAFDLQ